ncbi:MAG: hypothetical protein QXK11_07255 [Pyrobaculum sp.]|uniref:hypothetical protein n=1 Tax=Pyrobaculum sp. TaxID=2004705 RepID=UPI0031805DCF
MGETQRQQPQTTPPPPVLPLSEEEQKKLGEIINELILTAHEAIYTSNLLEDEVVEKYPELQDLKKVLRKLGRIIWEFHKMVTRKAPKS